MGINERPENVPTFSIPFKDNYVVRNWQPRDRKQCMLLIATVLGEHGLQWDGEEADRDVVEVERAYQQGEFWVVEDVTCAKVVGTGAFYEVPKRGPGIVEIRKMYLNPIVRGLGLGVFLLVALEERVLQLGYHTAVVETASVLKEACLLYSAKGYVPSDGLDTARCDMVLEKELVPTFPSTALDLVEVVDQSSGWSVVTMRRKQAIKLRLPFRAVVVQVQSADRILVHKRSMQKLSFPGKKSAVITGCVDWGESVITAAHREVKEEIGISDLKVSKAFQPFLSVADNGLGQRVLFHPFIATGDFAEDDIVCDPAEIEDGMLLTREEVLDGGIGGELWVEFRKQGF